MNSSTVTTPWWRRKKTWFAVGGLGLLTAALLGYLFRADLLPESSPYSRGYSWAKETACFSCHGATPLEAAFNPKLSLAPFSGTADSQDPAADSPAIVTAAWLAAVTESRVPKIIDDNYPFALELATSTQEELRDWIALGSAGMNANATASATSPQESRQKKARLLTMPAYGDVLSTRQLDDLVTFVSLSRYRQRALATAQFGTSSEGEQLARALGCFSCHGELGQGGVENPGSLKGYIPGFFGHDFAILTDHGDRQAIREWIADGVSKAFIEQSMLGFEPARFFTERQTVKMPAYGELLSDAQIERLVDYCLELQQIGPMDSAAVLTYQAKYAITPAAPELGTEATATTSDAAANTARFTNTIKPLLEKHCVECHGADTADNDYRLDKKELALTGGWIFEDTGKAPFVPGDSAKSLAFHFVQIDSIDEDAQEFPMPPRKKREPLSAAEIEQLRLWIDSGMAWPDGVTLTE